MSMFFTYFTCSKKSQPKGAIVTVLMYNLTNKEIRVGISYPKRQNLGRSKLLCAKRTIAARSSSSAPPGEKDDDDDGDDHKPRR
jgi:hypothetical protein